MSQGHVCKKIRCPAYRCCPLVTSLRMIPTHGGGQSRENHTRSSCSCSGDKAEEFGFSQHKEPILQRVARVINTTFFHRTLVLASLALCSAGRTKSAGYVGKGPVPGPSPWLVDSHLLPVSSPGFLSVHVCISTSFIRIPVKSERAHANNLTLTQLPL